MNGRWITRDKEDIEPLYCYIHNKPVQFIDLLGNRTEIPWDEYIEKELKKYESDKQKKRIERLLAYGCVGVVAAAFGRYPTSGRCYVTKDTTKTISIPKEFSYVKEMAENFAKNNDMNISKLVYFSIHLYLPPENIKYAFDETGRLNTSMWDKTSPTGEEGYFDYGLLQDDHSISSANHYYNPRGNNGKGYYFKERPIQEEKTTFYIYDNMQEWSNSMHDNEHHFNIEVWCFLCKQ